MTEFVTIFLGELQQNAVLELIAVILTITYLLRAVKQHLSCWYAAFVSSAIFLYVFWQVDLYMESALQVYYLAMAVYGWWSWQHHHGTTEELPITTWRPRTHALVIGFVVAATFVSGQLLADTDQRLVYLDSFTTWGAVITTFMVTRKILENWIYWLVIDSASIYLYLDRGLYFTSLLFAVYIIIIFFGLRAWLKDYRSTESAEQA